MTEDYEKNYEYQELEWNDSTDPEAKKKRAKSKKELLKAGWTVQIETFTEGSAKIYKLYAERKKQE